MTVTPTNRHQGMVGRLGNVSVNTLAPRGRPEKQSHGWEPVTLSRLVVVDTTMITSVIRKIRVRGSRIECAKAHAIPGPSNQTSKARCKSIDMLAHPAEQGKQSHGWYHVTLQGLGMTVATVITSTKIKKINPRGVSGCLLTPRGKGARNGSVNTLTLHTQQENGSHHGRGVTPQNPLEAVATVMIRSTAETSGSPRKRAK